MMTADGCLSLTVVAQLEVQAVSKEAAVFSFSSVKSSTHEK
jgi:hypothetical protein